MIYCITLIIIVALICVTRCYPLWVEHNRKKVERAMEIVAKVREENSSLRKELKDTYDQWLGEFNRKEEVIKDVFNNLYELTEKINKL